MNNTYHNLDEIINKLKPLKAEPADVSEIIPELSDIKVILFDIYGTMLISHSGDIGSAMDSSSPETFQEVLSEAELPIYTSEKAEHIRDDFFNEILKAHRTLRAGGIEYPEVDIRLIWESVLQMHFHGKSKSDIIELIPQVSLLYEVYANPVWPMPGIIDIIDTFKSIGIKLGIISNAQFYTPIFLTELLGAPLEKLGFDRNICAWSYKSSIAKPSTYMHAFVKERCFNLWGYRSDELLYIGNDMLNDVFPAVKEGYNTIIFAGDKRSYRDRRDNEKCISLNPNGRIKKWDSLAKAFSGI